MAITRTPISSGSPWEPIVGYSRAYKVGNIVFVSGTTGTDESGRAVGDLEAQVRHAIQKIRIALDQAGATLNDVVRTRMFVTDISKWETVGKVHEEFFGGTRPATSMVEVRRLIGDDLEFEIEADAVLEHD
jgi:enamine deaminase RidA (YjgF/YER057c/UK114 family)